MGILTERERLFAIGMRIHYANYAPTIDGLSHGTRRLLDCVLELTKDEEGYRERVKSFIDREVRMQGVFLSYARRTQNTRGDVPILGRICHLTSHFIGKIDLRRAYFSYFMETDALINKIFPPQRTPRLISPSEVVAAST